MAYWNEIFRRLFNRKFLPNDHKKMLYTVFLLEEMSAPLGDHCFHRYKNGIYSKELKDEFSSENNEQTKIRFSKDVNKDIDRLKSVLNKHKECLETWLTYMAETYYLAKNILPLESSIDDVFAELTKRDPYLNDRSMMEEAFMEAKKLCV